MDDGVDHQPNFLDIQLSIYLSICSIQLYLCYVCLPTSQYVLKTISYITPQCGIHRSCATYIQTDRQMCLYVINNFCMWPREILFLLLPVFDLSYVFLTIEQLFSVSSNLSGFLYIKKYIYVHTYIDVIEGCVNKVVYRMFHSINATIK